MKFQKNIINYMKSYFKKNDFILWFLFIPFIFSCNAQVKTNNIDEKENHVNSSVNELFYVSVKEFGAKGDGKTNDSPAFQKAIEFCEKNSRKTLFIPYGKFLLKDPIIFERGGVQIIGIGAILREESWLKNISSEFKNTKPFDGSTLIIPRNSTGFLFSETVGDPIRIADIQFIAQDLRTQGNTIGILFKSEFNGPTWPFIIERCHFNGFNFAVKFSSKNQYNVAFVQFRNNAFKQNDECVYFGDSNQRTSAGQRNLAWGFTFENNMCHDNSRILRAGFAKGAVNIRDNNFEGNVKYSSSIPPKNIIDIEVSNSTVNFEGNHFESIVSDAVSISSIFTDSNGKLINPIGTTSYNSQNKVIIKGNNFDGVNVLKFKPFILKGLLVYNYDQVPIYIQECDIRLNESNINNIFLSEHSIINGTTIKAPLNVLKFKQPKNLKKVSINDGINRRNISGKGNDFLEISKKSLPVINKFNGATINKGDKFIGAAVYVKNIEGSRFLGINTKFYINYSRKGKNYSIVKNVKGNYGYKLGENVQYSILPIDLPEDIEKASFVAFPEINVDIIGDQKVQFKGDLDLFTLNDIAMLQL